MNRLNDRSSMNDSIRAWRSDAGSPGRGAAIRPYRATASRSRAPLRASARREPRLIGSCNGKVSTGPEHAMRSRSATAASRPGTETAVVPVSSISLPAADSGPLNTCAPTFSHTPSRGSERIRPPNRADDSSTTTSRSRRSQAAARPDTPPPTTIASCTCSAPGSIAPTIRRREDHHRRTRRGPADERRQAYADRRVIARIRRATRGGLVKPKVIVAVLIVGVFLVAATPAQAGKWSYGNGPTDLWTVHPPGAGAFDVCTTRVHGRVGLSGFGDPAGPPPAAPPPPYSPITVNVYAGAPGSLNGAVPA